MRVTNGILFESAVQASAASAARLVTTSRIASTGMRVSTPSDDPLAFSTIVDEDAQIGVLNARSGAMSRASSDLTNGENALAAAGDLISRAHELALQANNASETAVSRATMGQEVAQIRESLIALANAKGANGYLFGGTQTGAPPFTPAGAFVGNDNPLTLEIATGVTMRVNGSGAQAFTAAGGRDVLADLQSLTTALATNNLAGINTTIDQLDADQTQVIGARVDIGLKMERLTSAGDVITGAVDALRTERAHEAEADSVGAYSDLAAAQASYQRGIEVTKQILSVTSVSRA